MNRVVISDFFGMFKNSDEEVCYIFIEQAGYLLGNCSSEEYL